MNQYVIVCIAVLFVPTVKEISAVQNVRVCALNYSYTARFLTRDADCR
jgi:hypothetical protein